MTAKLAVVTTSGVERSWINPIERESVPPGLRSAQGVKLSSSGRGNGSPTEIISRNWKSVRNSNRTVVTQAMFLVAKVQKNQVVCGRDCHRLFYKVASD